MHDWDDWLNDQERKEYRRFVKEDGREDEIRKATSTGRPLGDLVFIERLEDGAGRSLKPKKSRKTKKGKANGVVPIFPYIQENKH